MSENIKWKWLSQEGFASDYAWECERLVDASGTSIIDLKDVYPGYPECGQHLVMELSPANARLIECVPVMLEALRAIAEHKFISYEAADHYESRYGTGVVDGHRLCAQIARKALTEVLKPTEQAKSL